MICPHVRDRLRLETRRASYDEVRTNLFRYAMRYNARPAEGEAATYAYFCRICSEQLAEFIEEDRTAELLGKYGDLEAGMRTSIWAEALHAADAVRFSVPTDPKQFASVVTETVYPLVLAVEESSAKKTEKGRAPSGEVAKR